MRQHKDAPEADRWRREAAVLRARAGAVTDPATREQLLVFADDCDQEARRRDEFADWRPA